jgi:hypothetical protein
LMAAAIPDAPPALRPCFTCGKPTPDEVCAKCVPDDQPETYDARRKRIAAERTPKGGGGTGPYQQAVQPIRIDTRGEGIQRAVDRLSQVEHRVGAHAWRP